jgi:chorismate dehydratase
MRADNASRSGKTPVDYSSLRIGVVQYANALPLECDLSRFIPGASIVKDVPSALARQLARGDLDTAMVSSIELLRHPEYGFIPGLGVCSDGPVKSVCLFCNKAPLEIETVALDRSSLTSATVIRVLFANYWRRTPRYVSFDPPVENGLRIADAALTIGDPALQYNGEKARTLDVGELWRLYSGLPFVFAVWITRPGLDPESLVEPFTRAAESGLAKVEEIAQRCSLRTGHSLEFFVDYFTRCIHYRMNERDQEGMRFFFERAREILVA